MSTSSLPEPTDSMPEAPAPADAATVVPESVDAAPGAVDAVTAVDGGADESAAAGEAGAAGTQAPDAPSLVSEPTADVQAAPGAPATKAVEPTPAETAQRLKAAFPALFGGAAKPLKLRIQSDIQQRAPGQFSKRALSAFLHRHTGSTGYLLAITRLGQRFDLDGVAVEPISDEHREAAVAELTRRRAGQDARRAQGDEQRALGEQQRRNRAGLLRDFQTTTLTRANFCVLKQVEPDELEGLLERARQEAEEDRQRQPAFERPQRADRPPGQRQRPQGQQERPNRPPERQRRGPG